jgi:hypothetical protein
MILYIVKLHDYIICYLTLMVMRRRQSPLGLSWITLFYTLLTAAALPNDAQLQEWILGLLRTSVGSPRWSKHGGAYLLRNNATDLTRSIPGHWQQAHFHITVRKLPGLSSPRVTLRYARPFLLIAPRLLRLCSDSDSSPFHSTSHIATPSQLEVPGALVKTNCYSYHWR